MSALATAQPCQPGPRRPDRDGRSRRSARTPIPSLKQQLLAVARASRPPSSARSTREPRRRSSRQQVTKPIEDAVKGIDGLDTITSTSREGSASDPGAVRVRHRPRRRRQRDADLAQPDRVAAARQRRPDSLRRQHRRHPGHRARRRPAAATSASCPPSSTRPCVPELEPIEGVREASRHRRPRPSRSSITPDPAKIAAAGVDPARASPRRCRPTASPCPAGAVIDGDQ